MIEMIPVIIDSVTAVLELCSVARKKDSRPPKIKTQINNYFVTINQANTTMKETVEKPRSTKRSDGADLSTGEILFLLFAFLVGIIAVLRFYCQWEGYINSFFH